MSFPFFFVISMASLQLLHHNIPPLQETDPHSKALAQMQRFHVQHLPVIAQDQQYMGMLDECTIPYLDQSATVGELPLIRIFVFDTAHVYEVLKCIQAHQLSAVAVLNHQEEYVGIITLSSVLSYMAVANSVQEIGGIISLEIGEYDYVLSEIARIVEANDAKILSLFAIPRNDNSHLLDVTLKINRTDLDMLITDFERYGYEIRATYQTNEYQDSAVDHYHSLMNYLNI